jgi:S1-C subfamily serine protease
MRKIEEIAEKIFRNPNQRRVYIPWILALSVLIVVITLISNCNIGNRQFRQEMGEHWHPPAHVSPMIRVAAPVGLGSNSMQGTFRQLAEMLNRVTVAIKGSRVVGGVQQQIDGSGVVIGGQYVLTNDHVVQNASDLDVFSASPASPASGYHATVVLSDPDDDLALLKIQAPQNLPSATIGNSDGVAAGDMVFAMGNAFGKGNIFTSGVISDRNQTFSVAGRVYRNMIRTDTYMYPGSSGGPLADIRGQIIGINTAIYDPNGNFTGISFATPINRALGLLRGIPAAAAGIDLPPAMMQGPPVNDPATPFALAA